MLEIMRRLASATSSWHRGMKDTADAVGEFLVDAFHYLALFAIGGTTVWSAGRFRRHGRARPPREPRRHSPLTGVFVVIHPQAPIVTKGSVIRALLMLVSS